MKASILAFLLAVLFPAASADGADDADRILILVNDSVPPEAGTGLKGASLFVGEHYADRRGVPPSNIVHLRIPPVCCDNDPHHVDNWNITWSRFEEHVRAPIRQFLEKRAGSPRILYLVSTYGIPLRVSGGLLGQTGGISVDSVLAAVHAERDIVGVRNPYQAGVEERRAHFRDWTNPLGWNMYLVTRLDGPSAVIAAGLVDKAIRAESRLRKQDGVAYFDYRHLDGDDLYARADATVVNAHRLSLTHGFASVLNDQARTSAMIRRAPRTLWAWGWYSGPTTSEAYEFVEGAVGAQLTSYTANTIRGMGPGTWVPLWLAAGITATWGATDEPTVNGYAMGDNLLSHFWMGYNFAESSYLASPALNHMMVFVGDPLYAPEIFRPSGR
jgi:uncharacterized protein (TIGR03790 family)